jgi:tRNA A37 N6-isopentenylltransferase MiaA
MTWFRRHGDVVWLDMEKDPFLQASQLIEQVLEE